MNTVLLQGKLYNVTRADERVKFTIKTYDIYSKQMNSIRCTAAGSLAYYIENELRENDDVFVSGKIVGGTIKNDGGFNYYALVRARMVVPIPQIGYDYD